MRHVVQLFHESTDRTLVERIEIVRPVILITQPPDDDSRMIMMLDDHISKHPTGLFFVDIASKTAPTPRNFFPYQNAQFVAKVQNDFRLLVMS